MISYIKEVKVMLKELRDDVDECKKAVDRLVGLLQESKSANTDMVEKKAEDKFITVVDGWRGSLKLKECWAQRGDGEWKLEEDVELVCRNDAEPGYEFYYIDKDKEMRYTQKFKFRPFSPDNPPPIDWPVEVFCGRKMAKRHFKKYSNGDIGTFFGEQSSHTEVDPCITLCDNVGNCKFLNIEAVEDE